MPLEWNAEADTPPVDVRQQHHHYKEILNKSPEKKEQRKDILAVARDEVVMKENVEVDERLVDAIAKNQEMSQGTRGGIIESLSGTLGQQQFLSLYSLFQIHASGCQEKTATANAADASDGNIEEVPIPADEEQQI